MDIYLAHNAVDVHDPGSGRERGKGLLAEYRGRHGRVWPEMLAAVSDLEVEMNRDA